MEEEFNNTNEVAKIKSILKSNQFLIAIILLAIFIVGYEIYNFIQTYYEARTSLTLLYSFIHIFYEWYRGLVCLIIVIGLVSFIVRYRKNQNNFIKGLKLIIAFLRINLIVDIFVFYIIFIMMSSSPILSILGVLSIFGYYIFLIRYIGDWVNLLNRRRENIPNPLVLTIFLTIFSVFLMFHYFYIQFGGNYSISAYKLLYYINTPFIRIIFLLFIQVTLIFVISLLHKKFFKVKYLRILSPVIAGIAMITVISMGIIESSIPHYRFSVYDKGYYEPIEIRVTNGSSTISPVEFDILWDLSMDYRTLDSFLAQHDYDLTEHLNEVQSIDSKIITTLSMPDNTLVNQVRVYDEGGVLVQGIREWYDLDQLDLGTYFILVEISIIGDPSHIYADYLFILNVS